MSEVCPDCGERHRQGIMLRFTCAAWFTSKRCLGFLLVEAPPGMVLPDSYLAGPKLDAFVEHDMDERIEWHLLEKGWRRVGGRWICPMHPAEDFQWT